MGLGSGLLLCREKRNTKEILQTSLFILLYAIVDEYHQSFIPGRGASFKDVCIDTLGGISGILVVKMTTYTKNIYFHRESIVKQG